MIDSGPPPRPESADVRGRRIRVARTAIDIVVSMAESRGVAIGRTEDMVEHGDAGPTLCTPLGALVLDVYPRHALHEVERLLRIDGDEHCALATGYDGREQDDEWSEGLLCWYELGQSLATDMGLPCPDIRWPHEADSNESCGAEPLWSGQ